ncbi:IclR family transcriptional regulator [Paracandidimonas soli]|uniref:IclR family transcriptional regulator n=1 Tax=Paracandidimonas soli TaxID=1917182 RepID=UPI003340EF96
MSSSPATRKPLPLAAKPAVPAVERATRLLDMVALSDEPVTISGAARDLGLAKSTAHGLINTLVELGLLERSGAGVVMGGHVMFWANAFMARSDLVAEFVRLWDDGGQDLNSETASLTILDGLDVVYIASQHGTDPLGITFKTGMRLPAAYTATGKAILATLPDAAIRQLYAQGLPPPMTPHSVRSVDALIAELADVRKRGYSIDDQQIREGMVCFGAPVYDFSGKRAVGGIALSTHVSRLDDAQREDMGRKAVRHAQRLSRRLGFHQEGGN